MAADIIRLGMVGCGEIAHKATGPAIQEAEGCEMLIGVDPVAGIAHSYGQAFGIKATTHLEDVLGNSDVDAVVISAPHYTHAPLAIRAAEAGKHVLVEKPIATNVKDADRMVEACAKHGVLLGVLLCSRYLPEALKARELIAQGAIGDIFAVQHHETKKKHDSYWTGGFTGRVDTVWRQSKRDSGGGPLIMNQVHDIDRMRYVTGLEPVRVYAEAGTFGSPRGVQVEDTIVVTLRYDNGAVGTILTSSACVGNESTGNRIYGTRGQFIFGKALKVYTENDVEGLKKGEWTTLELGDVPTRTVCVERFAEAIRQKTRPDIPGEEGRKTLAVIEAAYRSAREQRPVSVG